jgi:hypothetical protein
VIVPSPSPSEVRLSDLLAWTVPITWHEAAAVVRQTGLLLLEARTPQAAPDPSGIWLSPEGTLRLAPTFGGEGDVVPSLAQLLRALLPESAPPDLAALADASNAKVATFRPGEFVDVLTFFCRPDDAAELQQLAARAAEARATQERSATLQALTDRARQAAPVAVTPSSQTRKPISTRRLVLAAGAGLVLVLGAGVAWTLTHPPPADADGRPAAPASPLQRVASRVQHSMTTAAAFVQETLDSTPAPIAGRGADLTLPARRAGKRGSTVGPIPAPTTETPVSAAPTSPVGAPASEPPTGEAVAAPAPVVDAVFSASHADVAPPVLARPQMPETQISGLPTGRPGVLELVIGRDGLVTSARLVPFSNRHQDRMMVSAAKTWRFSPAMRDGQAVSYRLQMPITW